MHVFYDAEKGCCCISIALFSPPLTLSQQGVAHACKKGFCSPALLRCVQAFLVYARLSIFVG